MQVRTVTPEADRLPHLMRWSSARLSLALFAASMSLCCAVIVAAEPASTLVIWLAIGTFALAVLGWGATFFSYFVGSGQTVRVAPIIKLFRRR